MLMKIKADFVMPLNWLKQVWTNHMQYANQSWTFRLLNPCRKSEGIFIIIHIQKRFEEPSYIRITEISGSEIRQVHERFRVCFKALHIFRGANRLSITPAYKFQHYERGYRRRDVRRSSRKWSDLITVCLRVSIS